MVICIETDQDDVPFIQLGSHCLRLDLEDLGIEDKERAEKELNETPENVRYGLEKLREFVESEPDLKLPFEDDNFFLKYLRPCRFVPENAFKILKRYYKFKIKHPKYGIHITPNAIRHVFDSEVFQILPTRTADGSRIFIMNCYLLPLHLHVRRIALQNTYRLTQAESLKPSNLTGHLEILRVASTQSMMMPTDIMFAKQDFEVTLDVIINDPKWDPKKVTLEDMFKAVMVSMEIAMLEPKTQLGGGNVILDLEGLSMVHFYLFSPMTAKLITDWIQECNAVRLKGIHIINQPYIFNLCYAVFKPFLGDKLRRSLFFHGSNRKSLLNKISPESMPEKYGGTANIPDYPGSLFSDMLFYYEHNFEVFNTYGYACLEN